ncbi:XRE family transcriptional regulator [Latilactobacillus curvatus]|uniref:XRE family transcriptional regulator n=1 Tax=Latilactobacillus curvatus TaxID=28038 RepID=UPI00223A914F|nr:XRE family transcriptional regulator [Latilactobacillus curvatus]MCS8616346.1 LexA family transcriptional regulator [Latilactobacillus curvatus]
MIDIKSRREELGLSQEDVAARVAVTRSTVSKWEKGDISNMKRDKIASLSKILRINPLELLGITPIEDKQTVSKYNFFDAGLSAGILNDVDPFMANDVKTIGLSDVVMGKYAGDKDIFITYINGESMNRIIPDGSLIAIKRYSDFSELCNGDIVVFQEGSGMAVKRFYNDAKNKIVTFTPDSSNTEFSPINYLYDSMSDVRIIGKVVVYTVTV